MEKDTSETRKASAAPTDDPRIPLLVRYHVDGPTPTTNTSDPCLHCYLARSPHNRLRCQMLVVACMLFCLSLLLFHPAPRQYYRAFTGSSQSALANDNDDKLLTSQDYLLSNPKQVQDLPSHLVPTTYKLGSSSNRRLVVIGDVHGVHTELKELLDQISFNKDLDHLIFAGDMINKGPDSHAVIKLMRSVNASAVLGNHEARILELSEAEVGAQSKHSDRDEVTRKELSEEDIEWLQGLPSILRLGKLPGHAHGEAVVVHAGLLPLVPLHKQKTFDVMHMRSISTTTGKGKGRKKHKKKCKKTDYHCVQFTAYEDRHKGDEPWWKVWNKVQSNLPKNERMSVFYGHDAHTGFKEKDWSVGLDSGCVSGGRLTAMIIEGEDEETGEARVRYESVNCKAYTAAKG